MNMNELKGTWEELNKQGLKNQTENEIEKIIGHGTSSIVTNINKKLFIEMAITALASIVSAFGIIFFYFMFDPLKHTWIDLSRIVPIQILGFVIFLLLFVSGWIEYKIINRKFTSETVKAYISTFLIKFKHYSRVFMIVTLTILAVTFYIEINYFIPANLLLKSVGSALLTAVSYAIIRFYYKKNYGSYLADLRSYQKELGA